MTAGAAALDPAQGTGSSAEQVAVVGSAEGSGTSVPGLGLADRPPLRIQPSRQPGLPTRRLLAIRSNRAPYGSSRLRRLTKATFMTCLAPLRQRWLRDVFKHLSGQVVILSTDGNITDRHDADQFAVFIEYW